MKARVPVARGIAAEVFRFLLVGSVGFIVDGGILMLLVQGGGVSRVWARIPSFLVAVTVTWWMHRHFTFASSRHVAPSVRELLRFVMANSLGSGLNLAVYWALVGLLTWEPLPALAVASIVAAGVNYAMSARWVFRPK